MKTMLIGIMLAGLLAATSKSSAESKTGAQIAADIDNEQDPCAKMSKQIELAQSFCDSAKEAEARSSCAFVAELRRQYKRECGKKKRSKS